MSGYTLNLETGESNLNLDDNRGSVIRSNSSQELLDIGYSDGSVSPLAKKQLFLLTLVLICLSFIYIFGFNGLSTRGYEISRLEKERVRLLNEREQNNVLLSESQALVTLEFKSKTRGMHYADTPEFYWSGSESKLALN